MAALEDGLHRFVHGVVHVPEVYVAQVGHAVIEDHRQAGQVWVKVELWVVVTWDPGVDQPFEVGAVSTQEGKEEVSCEIVWNGCGAQIELFQAIRRQSGRSVAVSIMKCIDTAGVGAWEQGLEFLYAGFVDKLTVHGHLNGSLWVLEPGELLEMGRVTQGRTDIAHTKCLGSRA